jgi:hypothetical protein
MSNKKCDDIGMCQFLEERLVDRGQKGFVPLHTLSIDDSAPKAEMQWRGVAYHKSSKDRGLLLNYCPFCGGRPGDLSHRDEAKKGGG